MPSVPLNLTADAKSIVALSASFTWETILSGARVPDFKSVFNTWIGLLKFKLGSAITKVLDELEFAVRNCSANVFLA